MNLFVCILTFLVLSSHEKQLLGKQIFSSIRLSSRASKLKTQVNDYQKGSEKQQSLHHLCQLMSASFSRQLISIIQNAQQFISLWCVENIRSLYLLMDEFLSQYEAIAEKSIQQINRLWRNGKKQKIKKIHRQCQASFKNIQSYAQALQKSQSDLQGIEKNLLKIVIKEVREKVKNCLQTTNNLLKLCQ